MSDVSQGPGWWVASDGKWYPPDLHPSLAQLPPPSPPVVPMVVDPSAAPAPGPVPVSATGDGGFQIGAGAAPKFVVPPIVPDLVPGHGGQGAMAAFEPGPAEPAVPVAPPLPQSLSQPAMRATGVPEAKHSASSSPWEAESPWAGTDDLGVGGRTRRSSGVLRATVDPRGAFVAGLSLVLVGACFLPYYKVSVAGTVVAKFTVIDHAFGSWRVAILAVSGLCVVIGILNSALRVGKRGAVTVFFTMRVLVLCQLGLWIAAMVDRTWHGLVVPPGITSTSLTWVAIVAVAVAVGALGGSVAAMGTRASPRG